MPKYKKKNKHLSFGQSSWDQSPNVQFSVAEYSQLVSGNPAMDEYVCRLSKLVTDDHLLMGIGCNMDVDVHEIDQIRADNQRDIATASLLVLQKARWKKANDHLFIEQLTEAFTEMKLRAAFLRIDKPTLGEPMSEPMAEPIYYNILPGQTGENAEVIYDQRN